MTCSPAAQVKADIPGQSKDKINLNVDNNTLKISVVRTRAVTQGTGGTADAAP